MNDDSNDKDNMDDTAALNFFVEQRRSIRRAHPRVTWIIPGYR